MGWLFDNIPVVENFVPWIFWLVLGIFILLIIILVVLIHIGVLLEDQIEEKKAAEEKKKKPAWLKNHKDM